MHTFFRAFISLTIILIAIPAEAQQSTPSQLIQEIRTRGTLKDFEKDTAYLALMNKLTHILAESNPDTAIQILETLPGQCRAAGYRRGEVQAMNVLGNAWLNKGNYNKAGSLYQQAFVLAEQYGLPHEKASILNNQGTRFMMEGDFSEALSQYYRAIRESEASGNNLIKQAALNNIAIIYFAQGNFDEAERTYIQTLEYVKSIRDTLNIIRSYNNLAETNLEQHKTREAYDRIKTAIALLPFVDNSYLYALANTTFAFTYMALDSMAQARNHFSKALFITDRNQLPAFRAKCLIGLAGLDQMEGRPDSAAGKANEALDIADKLGNTQLKRDAALLLSGIYESKGDTKRSLFYFKEFKAHADSLTTTNSRRAVEQLKAEYSFSKKELVFRQKATQQKWIIFSSLAALLTTVGFLMLINRNRNRLNHANQDLQQKNQIIETQRKEAETSLALLKETQTQLVHAEKMASLGALTAGIAHEIQNPLNFVNNFSEVSAELTDELAGLLEEGRTAEATDVAADLKANQLKIIEHGKRAQSIVRSMLQHSRKHSGQKDWIDINKSVEENLKLSYHGIKAKTKDFHARLDVKTDPSIQPVIANAQEMGRVLLNLYDNAFHAVMRKRKTAGDSYEPRITVTTGEKGQKIFIQITDNGTGIPENIRDKIFQPFFTTKASGEGTGLGLSLSHDIVTKSHQGELTCDSREGEGTTFTITLPRTER